MNGRIVGYRSNRRVPDRAALQAIAPVYRQLLAEEQRHAHPVQAIAAAVDGTGVGDAVDFTGLSQLAELLRREVTHFLGELRS